MFLSLDGDLALIVRQLRRERLRPRRAEAIPAGVSLPMSTERHKTLVRAALEAAFGRGELDVLDTSFTSDVTLHEPGHEPMRGRAELRRALQGLRAAFPDFQLSIQDQLAEDGRLAIRYVGQGTHQGEFLGIPATGRKISYTGMLMVRLREGRIAEFWAQPDLLGVLRQLGARVS
jgi:steroid delta-isomerase-like uncharacterized protein